MSIDDAFKNLMDGTFGFEQKVSRESPAVPLAQVKAELEHQVESVAKEPMKPDVPLIDLDRVQRIDRFGYHPIDSRSQIAEEYRILRTRLQSMDFERPSLLLTSCHHNEGKTNTALNLALTMAKRNKKKILLVDFDLRRPRLRKLLGLPHVHNDVVSVLTGKCKPEDAIIYGLEDNLYVLCAKREYSNGTDFLETPDARTLIDRLHATFDFVVMDSCPTLSTSDPAILGPYVGAVVMVVRCLETQRESINYAIESLREVGIPVVGVILTFMKYFIPRYLYRYQYYHGQYYAKSYGYGGKEGMPVSEDSAKEQTPSMEEEIPV